MAWKYCFIEINVLLLKIENLLIDWLIVFIHSPENMAQKCRFIKKEEYIYIQVHLNKLECHGKVNLFQ